MILLIWPEDSATICFNTNTLYFLQNVILLYEYAHYLVVLKLHTVSAEVKIHIF